MLFEVLIVAAVGVLSAAMRTYRSALLFRIGTLGFVFTSFLAGWLIGGNFWTGVVFASSWFLLPWLEILTRVRRMRLPLERELRACPPPTREAFPAFGELSEEVEGAGFEYVEDVGWNDAQNRQFYRLFRGGDGRTVGAICLVEQSGFTFYYVAFRSVAEDGRVLVTWNYPFSYGLHQAPGTILNREPGDRSISDLAAAHEIAVGREMGVGAVALAEGEIRGGLQADLRGQVEHNLACGILRREGEGSICYTMRGLFFLWCQFLRDFVRFS